MISFLFLQKKKVKIYATSPIYRFGQLFLYDILYSHLNQKGSCIFTEDDIDNVFALFKVVVYFEPIHLPDHNGNPTNIEITSYCAGHSIGGSIWKIRNDIDDIIYAIDFNHKIENHLNPCYLEKLTNPSLLICDVPNETSSVNRKKRDSSFFEAIMETLRKDGDVLIPVDTAGRVLEILYYINHYWAKFQYQYPVIFLSNTSDSTVSFARSQLEWMKDSIVNSFTNNRENAFDLKYVKTCISIQEMEVFKGPRIILATVSSLNTGFSLDLITQFTEVPENVVLFVDRGPKGSLAEKMQQVPTPNTIDIVTWRRVPLVGRELEQYRIKIRKEIEEWEAKRKKEIELRRKAQAAKDREYEGEDIESSNTLFDLWQKHDLFVKKDSPFEEMGLHPMFPYMEKRAFYDDYGEVIKIEDMNIGTNSSSIINDSEAIVDGIPCPVEEEVPTKPKLMDVRINIKCKVKFFDFEGRTDITSMKRIIKNVSPRRLMLFHGTKENLESMKNHFMKEMNENVFIPLNHLEPIDLSSNIRYTQINLKDEDLNALQFVSLGEYNLAYVNGKIRINDHDDEDKMDVEDEEKDKIELIIDSGHTMNQLLDQDEDNNENGTGGLIGNIKLSDFNELLIKNGFRTRIRGGVLEVNDVITIKKEETEHEGISNLRIDGQLCEDYYNVRDLMYNNLTAL